MTIQEQGKLLKLEQIASQHVAPCVVKWRELVKKQINSPEKLHLGHTLLELIAWLGLGIELDYLPRSETSILIRFIFTNLEREYEELKEYWNADWGSSMRSLLDSAFAQRSSLYPATFPYPVTQTLQAVYDTTLLLVDGFMQDASSQSFVMAEAFLRTPEWDALDVSSRTRAWAEAVEFQHAANPPPYWVPGYLNVIEYFDSLRTLFENQNTDEIAELKRRVYDFQRWRLNLHEQETKRRFDQVSQSIESVFDLIAPASMRGEARNSFEATVNAVVQSLTSGGELSANQQGRAAASMTAHG
jgi:hypothetical protein